MSKSTKKIMHHPFKWMMYDGQKVRIDKDIAPLLDSMWKLGIHTTSSCQAVCSRKCKHKFKIKNLKGGVHFREKVLTPNCKDRIWIAFAGARDMERFYNLVVVYEKWEWGKRDTMYDLINGWAGHDIKKHGKFVRYQPSPDNWETIHSMPNLGIRCHVERFPNNIPGEHKYYYAFVEDDCPKNKFRMQPQIQFPRKHLGYVVERLNKALERKKK